MGVFIGAEDLEGGVYDFRLTQLLLRGDSRLEAMLIDMADAGISHHIRYEKEAGDFTRAWLKSHGLPDIEDWFGEKGKDEVFPWDFIDNGVKKDYLWKRYVESHTDNKKWFALVMDVQKEKLGMHGEEYGIFAVRGPRGIPTSLSAALKVKRGD